MTLPVPDIINLTYPLFDITERERESLIKIEAKILAKIPTNNWEGLCYYTNNQSLLNKIGRSLDGYAYLHSMLRDNDSKLSKYMYECGHKEDSEIRNYLRLVWITKLLNQDVKL